MRGSSWFSSVPGTGTLRVFVVVVVVVVVFLLGAYLMAQMVKNMPVM